MHTSAEKQTPGRSGRDLLERHGDAMYRWAMHRLRSPHAAEDAVQDTLLAALSQMSKGKADFAGRSSERTWLFGILRHKVIDHIRRSVRETTRLGDAASPAWEEFFGFAGKWRLKPSNWRRLAAEEPHALLERAEVRAILAHCLDALPGRLAQVFLLREADEVDSKQICQTFRISPANLWTLLHRIRTRLRQCLDEHGIAKPTRR